MEETRTIVLERSCHLLRRWIDELEKLEASPVACGHICDLDLLEGVAINRKDGAFRVFRPFDVCDLIDDLEPDSFVVPGYHVFNIHRYCDCDVIDWTLMRNLLGDRWC